MGNSNATETSSGSGKRTKAERALPDRIDQPLLSQTPGTILDPNQLKLGLLILIIAAAVGGIFWSIKRFGDAAGGGSLAANPYANGEVAAVPPDVAPPPKPEPNTTIQVNPSQKPTTPQTPRPDPGSTNGPPPTQPIGNQVLPDFDRTPFGGVIEYVPTGGTLPGWVWQSRVKIKSDRAVKIRRGQPAEGEFRDLATALAKVEGNAVFEFADVGPHDISAFSMKNAGRWTLRGAEGVKPVLIIASANLPISIPQGTLSLEGVHVILPPERTGPGFRVGSENGAAVLTIRGSTLTHLGPQATDLIIAENKGRVVLEDSVVRSCGTCRPVVLRGFESALVAGQSLLIAGNASAIQIDSRDGVSDARSVNLVASACLSGKAGLACLHTGKQPPACRIHVQKSILAYLPGHSADAVGVQFSGWPKTSESLDRPLVPFINWTLESSSLIGWPHWAQLGFSTGAATVDVPDETTWKTFWRQETPTGVLISEGADLQKVQAAGALASSDQIQIGLASLKTQLAGAGPKWSALPEPPQQILAHGLAAGQRPKLAAILESPDPGTTLRFDLKKPNLGTFINSAKCPDGSTVIAFGAGLRTIDPMVIRQKRIQLVFEQTEGVQLVIQPGYRTEPNATSPPAWFSVEDGQLTLSHGTFRMMSHKTRAYPERFLQLTGGLAALRQCRVEGVDTAWPIIDTLPSGGHAPPQLWIDKSLIVGMNSLVRVGAAESLLDVRGSALFSLRGVAVTLDAGSAGSQCAFLGSSMSAGKAAFQVLPVGAGDPVDLFSRATVYRGGGVLSLETDAAAVHWWGFENAFASGMKTFLLTKETPETQNFTLDWVHHWGEGHELLPVFGDNDTLLPTIPAVLADVVPESFQLHSDCAAAVAGPTGKGVGAFIPQVGPARVAPTNNGPKNTTPVKPVPGVPGF